MLIGITGGSGCGKSIAAKAFEKEGIEVIDADKTAREVTKKGSKALCEISCVFGSEYIDENGELLRKKLGGLVFADSEKLEKLNNIINKYIRESIAEKLKKANGEIVVLDAPLLIEYGMEKMCDYVIAVLADEKIRVERICKRDNISEKDAINRIKSQKNDKFYLEKADYIVYNNSKRKEFENKVKEVIDILKEKM